MSELLQPLYALLEKAESLQLLIQAQDWDALESSIEHYNDQAAFLNDEVYLQALIDANQAEEARGIVAQIQLLNDLMDLMATDGRDKIASELRHMLQAGKALDAYGR